jgi:hypothetical protein
VSHRCAAWHSGGRVFPSATPGTRVLMPTAPAPLRLTRATTQTGSPRSRCDDVSFAPALRRAFDALVAGDPAPLSSLARRIERPGVDDVTERDQLIALLDVLDLWMAPVPVLDGREVAQSEPETLVVKRALEDALLARITERIPGSADLRDRLPQGADASGAAAVAAVRRIAAVDLVHPVYTWLADEADWDDLVRFLALEGGPDGGFDDLVALAQIGITGPAKIVLGANYWDEMGRGIAADVHTTLHDRLVEAISMPRIPRHAQPIGALERAALGGVLATGRHRQPELLGALGLLELQAGPRCRQVLRAFDRLGAPEGARPFYEEHAQTDPRHGKEWVDGVIAVLADDHGWAARLVHGARLRSAANARFFDEALLVMTGRSVTRAA